MSGAVFQALEQDSSLTALLGTGDRIFPDYSMETAPREGLFLILRWGAQNVTLPGGGRGPQSLTVWAHQPRENGSDYTRIRTILRRVQEVLEGLGEASGDDGLAVTDIKFQGDSGNLMDPGFQTITRNSTYRVLLHLVA